MSILNRVLLVAVGIVLFAVGVYANNLQVGNISVAPLNGKHAYVTFDISWENSWRSDVDGNALYLHDAAWVFLKVQIPGKEAEGWQHVKLVGSGINPEGYATGSGTGVEILVPDDRVGLFIRRSAEGKGSTEVEQIRAVWDFAALGIRKKDKVYMQICGIEMVYVAEGSFKVGDGNIGAQLREGGTIVSGELATPFAITNGGPIECGNESGKLWSSNTSGVASMGGAGTILADFPNGFNGFYCMKHEITQGQFADFLNTLTREQQESRFYATEVGHYMNASGADSSKSASGCLLQLMADPGETLPRVYGSTNSDTACNFLDWSDLTAFADWAGLRPMTDLEFEKACRGPLEPVLNEYAWGSTYSEYIDLMQGANADGDNYFVLGVGHWSGNSKIYRPLRAGVFARSGTNRERAGASYWGILDLSGNMREQVVTIGNSTGRAYTGLHGDGIVDSVGNANVDFWPTVDGAGAGYVGGSVSYGSSHARVSTRSNVANPVIDKKFECGGRAVRSVTPSSTTP